MELNSAPTTINYPVMRAVSEGGQWELGIYPVLYGFRVSCNRVGSNIYLKGGYCAGSNNAEALMIMVYLAAILESLPEEITEQDVDELLPNWKSRPIPERDRECLDELKRLALESEAAKKQ